MDEPKRKQKRALLNAQDKETYLNCIRQGFVPTFAANFIGKSFDMIWNTEAADPDFKKAVKQAKGAGLAQSCEEVLLKLARGECSTVEQRWAYLYDESGEPILDEKGQHKRKLLYEKETKIAPDKVAAKDWLIATRPEDWATGSQSAPMGDDVDLDLLWAKYAAKGAPAAPLASSDGASDPEAT